MAENNSYPNQSQLNQDIQDESINLQELYRLILSNWYWFAIALLITFSLGALYILRSTPVYSQSMQMLVRQDENRSSLSSQFSMYSSGAFGAMKDNMQNLLYALNSPFYMESVVRNLKLDVAYSVDGTFHDRVLYGKLLPVNVSFVNVAPDSTASMTIELNEMNKVTMRDFMIKDSLIESKPLVAKLGSLVQTPLGKIIVTPTKRYMGTFHRPINVRKRPFQNVVFAFSKNVQVSLLHDWASVFELKMNDESPERAADVLTEIFTVYNRKWIEDINEQAVNTAKFIDEELRIIEGELGNVDADISSYKSQNLVPDVNAASSIAMHKAEATSTQLLELSNQLYMARYI